MFLSTEVNILNARANTTVNAYFPYENYKDVRVISMSCGCTNATIDTANKKIQATIKLGSIPMHLKSKGMVENSLWIKVQADTYEGTTDSFNLIINLKIYG